MILLKEFILLVEIYIEKCIRNFYEAREREDKVVGTTATDEL